MTRLAIFVLAATLAAMCVVNVADAAKLLGDVSTGRITEIQPKLAASNGLMNIWDGSDVINTHNEDPFVSDDQGVVFTGWLIAVMVIVPLIGLLCIIGICVCICRACSGRQQEVRTVIYTGNSNQPQPPQHPQLPPGAQLTTPPQAYWPPPPSSYYPGPAYGPQPKY